MAGKEAMVTAGCTATDILESLKRQWVWINASGAVANGNFSLRSKYLNAAFGGRTPAGLKR